LDHEQLAQEREQGRNVDLPDFFKQGQDDEFEESALEEGETTLGEYEDERADYPLDDYFPTSNPNFDEENNNFFFLEAENEENQVIYTIVPVLMFVQQLDSQMEKIFNLVLNEDLLDERPQNVTYNS
jgi:hypothetical protein